MAAEGGCIYFMFLAHLPGRWIRYCHVTITHDALHFTVQGSPPLTSLDIYCTGTSQSFSIASDIWWPRLETCSNLYT